MSQMSFGDSEYAGKKKRTRREVFLAEMDKVVPWKALLALIEPAYPKAGRGRPPYALETMLRIHLMQNWFGFSDPAMEEALYEIAPVRQFAHLSLTRAIPDETTILNFRHILEANDLAPKLLQCVNGHLCDRGLLLKRGTMVDRLIMALAVAGVSMPVFFIGLIFIQYVGFKWGLLPFIGREGPVWAGGLPNLILPALTLGSVLIGPIARLTRTAVLEVLGADFVRTARAKGLREHIVIIHHALRNALIPVVTLIGLQAAFLLGGAVVTETMFSWPGVGRLAVGAITSSDFPTAQGAIMILALAFLFINLIVDVMYVYLDPRVQRQ